MPLGWSRISSAVLHARDTFGAMLVALLAELLLLIGAAVWLTNHLSAPLPTSPFGSVRLDLTKLPTLEPAPTAPPPPRVTAPAPPAERSPVQNEPARQQPNPLPEQPSDEALRSPDKPSQPAPDEAPMALPDLSLLPREQTAQIGPQQPAPPRANGQIDHISEFLEQLNAALRSASYYPEEARGMKLSGRVYLSVHYRDGKVWAPSIIRSSGFPILDQAVLEGVVRASWPPPPTALKGREIVVPVVGSFW